MNQILVKHKSQFRVHTQIIPAELAILEYGLTFPPAKVVAEKKCKKGPEDGPFPAQGNSMVKNPTIVCPLDQFQ